MATPQERLAGALEALHRLQSQGRQTIRSEDLKRAERELLVKNGFLQAVMKGWYIPARPDLADGESTAWYASYWDFVREYLTERFDAQWALSPEQSLLLHAGEWTVPTQLLVRARGGRNQMTRFLHGTSVLDVNLAPPAGEDLAELRGLRLYTPKAALIAASPQVFTKQPMALRTVLATQRDASAVLGRLLEGGHSVIAGRIAGAFRNVGRDREADAILSAMRAAGYEVREKDPFDARLPHSPYRRDPSPYVHRIRLMWETMRGEIPGRFPQPPGRPNDLEGYLKAVDDIYVTDAYHSLSIEGYAVNPELIERVRRGDWNPQENEADKQHRDAMAARGYWQAFNAVKSSVRRVLAGENPGLVADQEHGDWYRELFAPSVAAGLVKAANLAGYRNSPVHIRRSRHVPLNAEAVRDAMPAFFELLTEESEPAVRVVLGHFIFVYIHPYPDGNGRTGRLLMNVMMAAGGYPWTVIPVQARDLYMAALEAASVGGDIVPFITFLAEQIGRPAPVHPR
ncbi:MAG TPA: Fic family protein [Caulobacteraceae bacterium]|nr:Fic family protein [Caulobacteraceae bacterium]